MTFLTQLSARELESLKNVLDDEDFSRITNVREKRTVLQSNAKVQGELRNELNSLKLQNSILKSQLYEAEKKTEDAVMEAVATLKVENANLRKKFGVCEMIRDEALSNCKRFCSRIDSLDKERAKISDKHDKLQLLVRGLVEHSEFCREFKKFEPEFDKTLLKYLESTDLDSNGDMQKQQNAMDVAEFQRLQNLAEKYQGMYDKVKVKHAKDVKHLKKELLRKKKQLAGALRHVHALMGSLNKNKTKIKKKDSYCRKLEAKLLSLVEEHKHLVKQAGISE